MKKATYGEVEVQYCVYTGRWCFKLNAPTKDDTLIPRNMPAPEYDSCEKLVEFYVIVGEKLDRKF